MEESISRQNAIDALKAIKYGLWEIDIPSPSCPEYVEHHKQIKDMMEITDGWIKKLMELSPVQLERKEIDWIPFSERPPEEEGRYLVTDDAGGVKTVQDDEFLYREDGTPLWLYSQNVTAWRPLPEPYRNRGERDDTD